MTEQETKGEEGKKTDEGMKCNQDRVWSRMGAVRETKGKSQESDERNESMGQRQLIRLLAMR